MAHKNFNYFESQAEIGIMVEIAVYTIKYAGHQSQSHNLRLNITGSTTSSKFWFFLIPNLMKSMDGNTINLVNYRHFKHAFWSLSNQFFCEIFLLIIKLKIYTNLYRDKWDNCTEIQMKKVMIYSILQSCTEPNYLIFESAVV